MQLDYLHWCEEKRDVDGKTGKPVGIPCVSRPNSRLPTPIPVFPFLPLFDVLSITFPVNNPVTKQHVTSRVAMKP